MPFPTVATYSLPASFSISDIPPLLNLAYGSQRFSQLSLKTSQAQGVSNLKVKLILILPIIFFPLIVKGNNAMDLFGTGEIIMIKMMMQYSA